MTFAGLHIAGECEQFNIVLKLSLAAKEKGDPWAASFRILSECYPIRTVPPGMDENGSYSPPMPVAVLAGSAAASISPVCM